ncbi:unnamed protein product [Urochloa humidicola]
MSAKPRARRANKMKATRDAKKRQEQLHKEGEDQMQSVGTQVHGTSTSVLANATRAGRCNEMESAIMEDDDDSGDWLHRNDAYTRRDDSGAHLNCTAGVQFWCDCCISRYRQEHIAERAAKGERQAEEVKKVFTNVRR